MPKSFFFATSGLPSYMKTLLPTLLFASTSLHAIAIPDIEADLSAHWKLDGDALDSSGNGHNASADDTPQWSTGKLDQALNLVDETDTLTYAGDIQLGASFSISVWIKPNAASQDAGIWMKGTDGEITSHAKEISIFQGVPEFKYTHTDGQSFYSLSSNQAGTVGEWMHIAVVRDDSTGNAQIFVNGVLANEATETPTPVDGVAPSHFGHWGIGTGHFNGQIDDVRVYNRALSSEQVEYLSSAQVPPVAHNATSFTAAGVPLTITLSATDANDDLITYEIIQSPEIGSLSENSQNIYTYMAPADFEGTESITFQASDGINSSTATVTIHVIVPPVAVSSEITINQNQTTLIPFNIINPDNDKIYIKILEIPENGTLYQTLDGSTLSSAISRNNTVVKSSNGEVIFIPGVEESGESYATIRYQIIPGMDPLAEIPEEDKSIEPDFPTGSGTIEEPYQISNLPQLISFQLSGNKSKHYELTANIDASAYTWNSIPEFSGTFDGKGFSIYNLRIADGCFITNLEGTSTETHAIIRNLGLIDVEVVSDAGAAPLVLFMRGNSEIMNCFATGNVQGQNSPTSGLVGLSYAESGQDIPVLKNSWSSASVVNHSSLENNGGIAGEWEFGVMSNCYFGGSIDASNPNTGGLVGTSAAGTIFNCYSFGVILDNGGGLIGAGGANTSNSFWDVQSSGVLTSAAGTALDSEVIQSLETLSNAGWEVELDSNGDGIYWTLDEELNCGYPFLSYQTDHHVCAEASVTIHVKVVNDPPAFTSTPPATATEEQDFIYNLSAEDPEDDDFTFSGVDLPAWLSVDSFEGINQLAGIPQNEDIGTHTITLMVSDTEGNSSVQVFELLVIDINDLPSTSDSTTTVSEDEFQIINLPASDPDNDALTRIITELPAKGSLYQVVNGELVGDRINQQNTLLLDPHGKVYFVSGSDENGEEYTSFKFQVMDGAAAAVTNDTASTFATKPSGDGSANNPYQISILGHLSWLAQNPAQWDANFLQTADIDASPTKYWDDLDDNGDGDKYNDPADTNTEGRNEGFPPIGSQYITTFSGNYDGRGNSIIELTINRGDRANIGFFGKVENANIRGLGIENANISGNANVGALVGNLHDSVVENSFSTGSVTGALTGAYSENIGGLIGQMVGISSDAFVSHSWSGVNVVNPVVNGGGLIGLAGANTYISHSFANGSLSGAGSMNGGLVGEFSGILLDQTYSLTSVTTTGEETGGLVGSVTGTVENSFWDTEKSGLSESTAGTGLTSEELRTLGSYEGWTFSDPEDGSAYWILNHIANDGFPYLNWQKVVSLSNESSVAIDVTPVSDPPVLASIGDHFTNEDIPLNIQLVASDRDGDTLSITSESSVNIAATISGSTLTLTPATNWHGTEPITVYIDDGEGNNTSETFGVTVIPVDDIPVINLPTDVSGNEDTSIGIPNVSVEEYDGENVTVSLTVDNGSLTALRDEGSSILQGEIGTPGFVVHGNAASINETLATLAYNPTKDFSGQSTMIYTISDGNTTSEEAQTSIIVIEINDAPFMATIGNQNTDEDTPFNLELGASDVEEQSLTFSATNSTHISTKVEGSVLTISPAQDFNGTESITVTVTDEDGATDSTTFDVIVAPVNDTPAISGISAVSGNEDSFISFSTGESVEAFAGDGTNGHQDGPASAAKLSYPNGMAMDSNGNIYWAEYINGRIRKIDTEGNVTTFAGNGGSGHIDGTGTSAGFKNPYMLAIDNADNLYVTDTGSHVIRKITPEGIVSTLAGSPGAASNPVDGTGAQARFSSPIGLAYDNGNNFLYVADYGSSAIRKIDLNLSETDPSFVTTLAGSTSGISGGNDGTGTSSKFQNPHDITIDSAGNLYVSESVGRIRKITQAGEVTTIAGDSSSGYQDGTGIAAKMRPTGLSMLDDNTIIFYDNGNYIRVVELANNNEVKTLFGNGSQNIIHGDFASANISGANNIEVLNGNLYIPETATHSIHIATFGTSFQVYDVDFDILTARLEVNRGNLMVSLAGEASIINGANGSSSLVISGTASDINATLKSLEYIGSSDFYGEDTLIFSIGDGTVETAPQSTSITIANIQDAPQFAGLEPVVTNEDTPVNVSLSAFDADEDDLTFEISVESGNVTVTIEGSLITITPASDWYGTAILFAEVDDGNGGTDSYEFGVEVLNVNDAPTSENGTIEAVEDVAYELSVEDFSFNDVDGDSLVKVRFQAPTAGFLWVDLDGNNIPNEAPVSQGGEVANADLNLLRYQAPANAYGENFATISFEVFDGTDYSASSYTFTIHVEPVEEDPTAFPVEISAKLNIPLSIILAGTDPEDTVLSFTITSLPENGKLYQTSDGSTLGNEITAIDTFVERLVPAPGPGTLNVIPAINGSNTIDLTKGGFSNFEPGVEYSITSNNGDMTIEIAMWGAGGGNGDYNDGANGGGGGMSSGKITLLRNTPYKVIVGEGGKGNNGVNGSLGGYPGGGYGTKGDASGAGGGGYTGIFINSIAHANSILIAGGGGGATDYSGGGLAGAGGGTNGQNSSSGAQGGTQTSGGSAVSGGADGSELQGGNGDERGALESTGFDGGGGGGGYYGGEGGFSDARAGAGGSGYVHPVLVSEGQTLTGNYSIPANSEKLPSFEFSYGATDSNQDGKPGYLVIKYIEGATAQGANLIYVPDEDYVGEDSFSYKVTDRADLTSESSTSLATFEPQVEFSQEVSELAMFTGGSASWLQINPLPVYEDFTIEFWLRTTDQGGTNDLEEPGWENGHGLVDASMPGQQADFGISLLERGIAFGVGSEENGDTNVYSFTKVAYGEWFHVAATRNSETGEIQLYIDGYLEGSAIGTTEPLYDATRLVIGQLQTMENPFLGDIADLRIYNSVRTDAQIIEDANNLSETSDPALIGYYTFEEFIDGPAGGGQQPWDLRKHFLLVSFGEESSAVDFPAELLNEDIRQVAAGPDYVLALTASGSVHGWGDNLHEQIEIPEGALSGVRQIAATQDVAYALKTDGTVVAWGRNDGNRLNTEDMNNIVKIVDQGVTALFLEENGRVHIRTTGDLSISDVSEWSTGVQDIASSPLANLAIIDGEAVVIGSTSHGLIHVPEEALEHVISVHAMGNTLFARKLDGSVVAWGSNANNLTSGLADVVPGTTEIRFDGGLDTDHQLVLSTGGNNGSVDPEWDIYEYNQSVYFITPTPMTWPNAEAWAVSQGGHLASVDDAEEQAFLAQVFNFNSFWIGLYRIENSWDSAEWSNGSTSTYRNWNSGEPNGPGPGGEPATQMHSNGTWNDLSEHASLYGLVEISDTKKLRITTFLSGEGPEAGLIDSNGQLYIWGSVEGGVGEVPASMRESVKQAEKGSDFIVALVLDNDADHLPDTFETDTGEYLSSTDTGTSSSNPDQDEDGILDGDEVTIFGSNPLSTDSDEDGLSDKLELLLGLNLISNDSDNDTFSDLHEYETGTDPLNSDEYPESSAESQVHILADTTNDSDQDGLTDGEEIHVHNTNPDAADQDEDGLLDGQEIALGTSTNDPDSDQDTFSDGHEYETGTDPLNSDEYPESSAESQINILADTTNDSDQDGLTDGEEIHVHNTNPDAADQDEDGLLDGQEIALGTSTNDPDSDQDTFSDGHEYETGTDPLNPDEYPESSAESQVHILADTTNDSDQDGLTDGEEIHLYSTNIHLSDSDEDGLSDSVEIEIGTNPNLVDTDQDTFSDTHEFHTGTDPLNADEYPEGSAESALNTFADTTEDSDGDGLSDGEEIHIYQSNPESEDSDNDGVDDRIELELGLQINQADSDNDGSSDGDELSYGTEPLNAESRLLSISGTLTYDGRYDSQIYLVIERNAEVTAVLQSLDEPGVFTIAHLQNHYQYKVWSFLDLNSDQEYQEDEEPVGTLFTNFTALEGNLQQQVILLEDPNSPPEDILLSSNQVEENAVVNTLIGTFTPVDPDEVDSFQYSLVAAQDDGANDNALFTLEGANLLVAQQIDYEANSSPTIWVQVADSYGETFTKSFTIKVTNLFTPIITTNIAEEMNNDHFRVTGSILHDGGAEVLEKGVLFGTSPGLSISSINVNIAISNETSGTTIDSSLQNLTPNREYYYRTYAQNSEGVAYGQERKFKTPKEEISNLWVNATSLGNNWYELEGFGVFYLQDNFWIFHQNLGWLYAVEDDDGFWLWNGQLGWVWTRLDIYPYLWKDNSDAWIHYLLTNETDRVFYNATTDSLEFFPL